jgi:hypothetical protein
MDWARYAYKIQYGILCLIKSCHYFLDGILVNLILSKYQAYSIFNCITQSVIVHKIHIYLPEYNRYLFIPKNNLMTPHFLGHEAGEAVGWTGRPREGGGCIGQI